jgi:hypothetical protein
MARKKIKRRQRTMDKHNPMNKHRYAHMIIGLIDTAKEKICVLGAEDAQKDTGKIREMIEDLECFWNSDGRLGTSNWIKFFDEELQKMKEE